MFGKDRDEAAGDPGNRGREVISVIGPGMEVEGDCGSEGSVRVEGRVEGQVRAAKSVVVGEEGEIVGDVHTQDAVVAGRVQGTIRAASRVELKATCRVRGNIESGTVKLEEGGRVDGELRMTDRSGAQPSTDAARGERGGLEASASRTGAREDAGSRGSGGG